MYHRIRALPFQTHSVSLTTTHYTINHYDWLLSAVSLIYIPHGYYHGFIIGFYKKLILFMFQFSFSENHFSPRFVLPCSLLAKNICSIFQSLHLPLDTQFSILDSRLPPALVMRSRSNVDRLRSCTQVQKSLTSHFLSSKYLVTF